MTDKEWAMLKPSHGYRDVNCHHADGDFCTANNKGRCVCLYNTQFPEDICPFFHDRRTMSALELAGYRKLFYYRGEGNLMGK